MTSDRGRQALWTAIGVTAGVATGLWMWARQRTAPEPVVPGRWDRPGGAGSDVAEALRGDRALSHRAIEVDAIADGVVELTGSVRGPDEADRAVRLAQNTRGVYTVVNRLTVESEEAHREDTRRRREDGDASLQGGRHYGMGVGMGTRRQSPDTDPDRPSDKQKILDRSLDVGNVEDAPDSGLDPVSGAEAVESERVKPGDEAAIRDAGLDPEPRPTSTPKESTDQAGGDATEDGNETVRAEGG